MPTRKAYRIAMIVVFVMIFVVIPFFGQWALYPMKKRREAEYLQRVEAAKEVENGTDNEQSGIPAEDTGVRSEVSDRSIKEDIVSRTTIGSDSPQVKTTATKTSEPVTEQPAEIATPPTSEAAPVHVHEWKPITQTIHHDATGHMETVVVIPGYDEVTYTQTESGILCRDCGRMFSTVGEWEAFVYASIDAGDLSHGSYEVCFEQTPTTIHHDPVYGEVWIEDTPAYDEEVVVGYECGCGEKK